VSLDGEWLGLDGESHGTTVTCSGIELESLNFGCWLGTGKLRVEIRKLKRTAIESNITLRIGRGISGRDGTHGWLSRVHMSTSLKVLACI
jgi:hypothetical protein